MDRQTHTHTEAERCVERASQAEREEKVSMLKLRDIHELKGAHTPINTRLKSVSKPRMNVSYHRLCRKTMFPPRRMTLQVFTTAPTVSVAKTTAKTRDLWCRIE